MIGTGGDLGGSIRMPCFFCGVFGHKPTPGIVSVEGHYPVVHEKRQCYLSFGPMCRYAEDLVPMFRVMAGDDAIKKFVPRVLELAREPIDFKQLTVYYAEGTGDPLTSPVDNELILAIRQVTQQLTARKRLIIVCCLGGTPLQLHVWLTD